MKTLKKETLNFKKNIYWLTWVKWVASLTIFVVVLINNNIKLEEIHLGKSINLIRKIPNSDLFLYLIFGLISIIVISLYDFLWFYYNPVDIKKSFILKTSFIANSINNLISLGGISGSIVRFIFYRNSKISDSILTKLNILLFPSFFTGLSVILLLSLINIGNINPTLINKSMFFIMVVLFTFYLTVYFFSEFIPINRIKTQLRAWGFIGNLKLKISMILISSFDWLSASLFFWFISIHFTQNLAFLDLLYIFSFAYSIGINSSIPSSLGVFDILMIIGLTNLQLSITDSFSIILLYRIFYYIIPFIIGLFLTIYDLNTRGNNFFQLRNMKGIIIELEKKITLSQTQQEFFKDILSFLFEILIFLASILTIITSIMPSLSERIYLLGKFVSLDILIFSQKTSFIIGVLLLVLTYDIKLRLKSAYYITLFLLGFSTIFILLKGLNIEECLILMIITYAFKYTKNHFYRISIPVFWSKIVKEMIISQTFIILYVFSGQLNKSPFYLSQRGIELLYMTPVDYINNGIIFTFIIQGFILLWNLFEHLESMKAIPWRNQTKPFVYQTLDLFLSKYKGSVLSHLVYNGDKYIYISKDNNVLISFSTFNNKVIVLGDPIGNTQNIISYLDEFRIFIDIYGYIPVYYQISEKYMPKFHEVGYAFFKLGEDAIINLNTYNLSHKNQKEFNHIIKTIEEKNWRFEMFYPPYSDGIINDLKKVSNEWLDRKIEKGFSLGFFDRDFLNKNPVACLCSKENEIVAFTSLTTIYEKELFSVDLIRFSTRAPKNSMDYLFLKLFNWGLNEKFRYFYFGMAPLFNVGISKYAEKKEKIAKIIFKNLKITYNFEGLYKYKNKFNPTWESKYLAYPKNMRVEFILLTIILLISSKKKKRLIK